MSVKLAKVVRATPVGATPKPMRPRHGGSSGLSVAYCGVRIEVGECFDGEALGQVLDVLSRRSMGGVR